MTGARVGTRKAKQPLAPPSAERNTPEHWDKAALIARGAQAAADNRKDRRYWKKAAEHAEAQARKLRQQ